MKHLIAALTLCLLAACAGSQSTTRAPKPHQSSENMSALMRKTPEECRSCVTNARMRVSNCGTASGSCMSSCRGDAMQIAMCQSACASQHASCAAYASIPVGCPAYCQL